MLTEGIVKSDSNSGIRYIIYNGEDSELFIHFERKDGRTDIYKYFDVEIVAFINFMLADSHGRYFHRVIRNSYTTELLK